MSNRAASKRDSSVLLGAALEGIIVFDRLLFSVACSGLLLFFQP